MQYPPMVCIGNGYMCLHNQALTVIWHFVSNQFVSLNDVIYDLFSMPLPPHDEW